IHHLLLFGWARLFGTGDAAMRVPSAATSIASVGVLWLFGRRSLGQGARLVAVFLLAVSPTLLLYGRMARYFSPSAFLALLSSLLLVIAVQKSRTGRGSARMWGAYAVSAFAMVMTNYTNLAILGSQALAFALWARRGETARAPVGAWALALGGVLAPFAAWIAFDFRRVSEFGAPERPFEIGGWEEMVLDAAYPFFSFSFGETIFPWHPAVVVALPLVVWALWKGVRWSLTSKSFAGMLAPIIVAGTLGATVLSYQTFVRDLPFVTVPARTIGALPFFLLLLAAGVTSLPSGWRAAAAGAIAAAVVAATFNYFDSRQFNNPALAIPKRRIVSDVLAKSRPGDLVVADEDLNIDYYYPPARVAPRLILSEEESLALREIRDRGRDRVWLITMGRDGTRGKEPVRIETALHQDFRLITLRGYLPQDRTYIAVKEAVQGFESYRFKATVRLFERDRGG
ncbi:MAG: glycosyltransferase family 39 protein, partial [Actinomycetota bacterium]